MTKEHPVICNSLNRNTVSSVHVNAFSYSGRHHLFKKTPGNTYPLATPSYRQLHDEPE